MTINRRQMLGRAASAAATLVVSQSVFACTADATGVDAGADSSDITPGSANASCVLTASLTEGPYFVDERLLRSDIRADPSTAAVSAGTPLELTFNVARISAGACSPLTGAYLDVWHCDAAGVYSDEAANNSSGRRFLRGYQITDASGVAKFTTVYPGWYNGRAVHIHFKLRLFAGATRTYEFTSQFFFDESLTSTVHATSPYNTRGTRDTRNTTDGIYNGLTTAQKSALTLSTTKTASGYSGIIDLTVNVG
jgi:protocatechuate 3,4-dioxygenase beta subunit